ncbi:MAG: sodium:solute symporter [Saprospiraceae bacterium]|nr:sodium:solute symporter [Saprospiraceae bacterium]
MHIIDWVVLILTTCFIVIYGAWKTRKTSSVESYLLGDRDLKWWTIGLSIMATQASGITFLSTPGQAYDDGMRFVQFYFGLPIAMIILAIWVIPQFYKLKVFTAYEYLETRFDLKTRFFTAALFLIQRGLAAGLTIYAPSIILSTILGWNLTMTNLIIGGLVVIYTAIGGTKAVSETQQLQMGVILIGLFLALGVVIYKLPPQVSFSDALSLAGGMGKLNLVDFNFNPSNKYNFWSGILGGTFLFLSYFGTDQSQVQRYLSGKSLTESRLGLLFNGILKVPMQFAVLFVGMMVFVFYQFTQPPIHFNHVNIEKVEQSSNSNDLKILQTDYNLLQTNKDKSLTSFINSVHSGDKTAQKSNIEDLKKIGVEEKQIRSKVKDLVVKTDNKAVADDTDYIFITFVTKHMPIGIIGLLIAVIFAASMSSTSSELNALATTTVIDFYKRAFKKDENDQHYFKVSIFFTLFWGALVISFAIFVSLFENLIEAINIIGSIFYGSILGIFMTAFFLEKIKGNAVFYAAIITQLIIFILFFMDKTGRIELAYLWLNPIGCFLVMIFAILFNRTEFGIRDGIRN